MILLLCCGAAQSFFLTLCILPLSSEKCCAFVEFFPVFVCGALAFVLHSCAAAVLNFSYLEFTR